MKPKNNAELETMRHIRLKVICPICGRDAKESMSINFSSQTIDKRTDSYDFHDEGITCCNLCGTYLKKVLMNKVVQMTSENLNNKMDIKNSIKIYYMERISNE